MRAVGVDGYRRGWVAVVLEDGAFSGAWTAPTFGEIRARCDGADAIGVDIPIGLEGAPRRPADEAAKAFLRPRGSAVFPTYPEWLYRGRRRSRSASATRRRDGSAASAGGRSSRRRASHSGRGSSSSLAWTGDPAVVGVHPEVSFRELAGRDLGDKKTWNGVGARRRALAEAGIDVSEVLPEAARVRPDDVLDAAVAAWTAWRYTGGAARPLPDEHPRGRPGAIWR